MGIKRKDRKEREGKRQGEDSSPRPLLSQNVKERAEIVIVFPSKGITIELFTLKGSHFTID